MINSVTGPFNFMPSTPAAPAAVQAPDQGFGKVLAGLIEQTAATLHQGETAAIAGIEGRLDTFSAVQQVMAAERAFQAAIAIRDKAVGAYLEINRMQI